MSFLKKTTTLGVSGTTPKLGATLGTKKLGGGLKITPKEIEIEPTTPAKTIPAAGSKKLGGGLGKKLTTKKTTSTPEPQVEEEEVKTEDLTFEPATTPKLTTKKLGAKKKLVAKTEEPKEEQGIKVEENGDITINAEYVKVEEAPAEPVEVELKEEPVTEEVEEEVKEETKEEPVKEKVEEKVEETTKKKSSRKKSSSNKKKTEAKKEEEAKIVAELEVDESKRVSIEEMDTVMRPIVAPTTEHWEQEKKDVLEALDNIKVEQDMTMSQVKEALANLDELNFMILPRLHDAETMYDGTKQNYDTVKAVAIAKGSATNAEGRKAEGIIACQNFVTPSGAVVDLHQYMLLIEERYKFYQKITDGINFKKYSLVNYNNALKVESKNA